MLVPLRVTRSVILLSTRNLRKALDHATGAAVISISLGGPFPGFGTQRAIQRALDRGAIVLAAAGNEVGPVVYPAALDEVIAVAAVSIRDRPWSGSCHGAAVDISAPGESVWRAEVRRLRGGTIAFDVKRGHGTSFAVATTAGVAALWVSFHGWRFLFDRYGAAVSRVFKSLLQATCRTPAHWDEHDYGPGIVDAGALLEADLPAAPPARKLRDARRPPVASATGLETLVYLFPDVPRTNVERALARLLNVRERRLPQVLEAHGEELAFHLVMNPRLQHAFARSATDRPARLAEASVRRRLERQGLSAPLRQQLKGRAS
jgi:subtilisin family serine protease